MYPRVFCEVFVNKGLIFARVKKSAKERERGIENKGVSESLFVKSEQKCEVVENEEVRGILRWARGWWDAVRITEGVVLTTKHIVSQ